MDLTSAPELFGIAILLLQAVIVITVLACLFDRDGWIIKLTKQHALKLVTFVGAAAIVGSLTLSEGLGWDPCKLCWFQRIFLYPAFFIGIIAWWKKDYSALRYVLTLSIVGLCISIFHYWIQMTGTSALPCSVSGPNPSCNVTLTKQFGYMTIPLMALTLSLYAIVVSWITLMKNKMTS